MSLVMVLGMRLLWLVISFGYISCSSCNTYIVEEHVLNFDAEDNIGQDDAKWIALPNTDFIPPVDTRLNEKAIFEQKPFDYNVDLPTSEKGAPFNSYFGLIEVTQRIFFFDFYFDMFVHLYPGLREVPIHHHDISGLVAFMIFYSHLEDTSTDYSFAAKSIMYLFDYFDPNSEALLKLTVSLEHHFLLSKDDIFDLLFDLAFEYNLFYTIEAFIATGMKRFSMNDFLRSVEKCNLGEFRLSNRILFSMNNADRYVAIGHLLKYSPWGHFGNVFYEKSSFSFQAHNQNCEVPTGLGLVNLYEPSEKQWFSVGGIIEEGGVGTCYHASSKASGKKFALKIIPKHYVLKKASRIRRIKKEVAIHASVSHRNIVRLFHAFEDKWNIYLMTELCEDMNVFYALERGTITMRHAAPIMLQLLSALKYLHSLGIVHHDLKPENIFLRPGLIVKLGDFGFSELVDNDGNSSIGVDGTLHYLAPEVLEGYPYRFESDIWSVGLILYFLLEHSHPFLNEAEILCGNYEFPPSLTFSWHGRDLIRAILKRDPKERPSIDEILSSQFFRNDQKLSDENRARL